VLMALNKMLNIINHKGRNLEILLKKLNFFFCSLFCFCFCVCNANDRSQDP
jgi:hypothetical protein